MNSYKLEVRIQKDGGQLIHSQGTAWAISLDTVVTAFHVLGDMPGGGWFSDIEPTISYWLQLDYEDVELEPMARDHYSDVALLRRKQKSEPHNKDNLTVLSVGEWGAGGLPLGMPLWQMALSKPSQGILPALSPWAITANLNSIWIKGAASHG